MERLQHIVYNVTGQTLRWDCPEGQPSSVTSVTVYRMGTGDDGTTESATTGTASIDSVDTTVDAASGSGQSDPAVVNVAATTGMEVGREYLLTGADGFQEWVEVVAIDSGNSVTARHPLHNAYAAADTVQGTRLTISVSSTWIADVSKLSHAQLPSRNFYRNGSLYPEVTPGYRVRWVYVVSGVTYVHDGYFDVVRYPGGSNVTPADIEEAFPGYRDYLPDRHAVDEGRRLISQAYEEVRWDLKDANIADFAVRDVDALDRAIVLRFGVIVARDAVLRGAASTAALDLTRADYAEFLDKQFRTTPKARIDTDNSGAGSRKAIVGLMSK